MDEAVFYIGHGTSQAFLRDLRCSILEDRVTERTFEVGQYFEDDQKICGIWAFIRHYHGADPPPKSQASVK